MDWYNDKNYQSMRPSNTWDFFVEMYTLLPLKMLEQQYGLG